MRIKKIGLAVPMLGNSYHEIAADKNYYLEEPPTAPNWIGQYERKTNKEIARYHKRYIFAIAWDTETKDAKSDE